MLNIEKATKKNKQYRKIINTVPNLFQLVLMSLKPGEDIPLESHDDGVQFIRVESGKGIAIVGKTRYKLSDGSIIIIKPGQKHYVKNTSKTEDLKLYTIYTPPVH